MDEKPVGVLGARSLVGKCLLPQLVSSGYSVKAFSRRPQDEGSRAGDPARVVWNSREGAIAQWISLVPIWALPDFFPLLKERGARRVVVLSSTSKFTKSASSDPAERETAERLRQAEESLADWAQAQAVEWVVLRPTLIYGLGEDTNVTVIANIIRRFGFFPLFGEGRGLRQPVHAEDVAQASVAALQSPQAKDRAYNLSGGEVLSYQEMVGRIFAALHRRPRLVRVPLWAFRIAVAGARWVPRFRHWSSAMAERMNQDMIFDHGEAAQDLAFSPRAFRLNREDCGR